MDLRLSIDNWWQEIEGNDDLPESLKRLLKALIGATFNHLIPPVADENLVKLAKEHLQDDVWIGSFCYSLMVYVPEDTGKGRSFFLLMPRYCPNGKVKKISKL